MKTILLLLTLWKQSEGNVFTAFHPTQKDFVHQNSTSQENIIDTEAIAVAEDIPYLDLEDELLHEDKVIKKRRVFNYKLLPTVTSSAGGNFLHGTPRQGFLQRYPNIKFSGNIVEQSEAFLEAAKELFKIIGQSEQANLTLQYVFKTSDCLGTTSRVIKLTEDFVNVIKRNAPEIIYLQAIVDNLESEKNVDKFLVATTKMVRALKHLIPNLMMEPAELCISTPKESVRSFRSLGHALIDIMNHRDIPVDDIAKELLQFSSKVMYETANFLALLDQSIEHFKSNCQNGQMQDLAIYHTIEDILNDLASFFEVLDMDGKAKDIKKQAQLIRNLVVSFPFQYKSFKNVNILSLFIDI